MTGALGSPLRGFEASNSLTNCLETSPFWRPLVSSKVLEGLLGFGFEEDFEGREKESFIVFDFRIPTGFGLTALLLLMGTARLPLLISVLPVGFYGL